MNTHTRQSIFPLSTERRTLSKLWPMKRETSSLVRDSTNFSAERSCIFARTTKSSGEPRANWKPFSTRPGSHESERWLIIHRESRHEPWHNLEYPSPLGFSFLLLCLSLSLSLYIYIFLSCVDSGTLCLSLSYAHLRESSPTGGTACKILEPGEQPRQQIISRCFSYIAV